MLIGENSTQPRPWTPTSEYGLLWENWKLVTLAGQSNYYTNASKHINPPGTVLPCLSGAGLRVQCDGEHGSHSPCLLLLPRCCRGAAVPQRHGQPGERVPCVQQHCAVPV